MTARSAFATAAAFSPDTAAVVLMPHSLQHCWYAAFTDEPADIGGSARLAWWWACSATVTGSGLACNCGDPAEQ
jgi:hypothetical protein